MSVNKISKEVIDSFIGAGFFILPIGANKISTVRWTKYMKKPMGKSDAEMEFTPDSDLAIMTGGPSRVICMDIDSKYDLSGDLFERLKSKIPAEILKKLYIQSTRNNGYHFVFKVPSDLIRPNEKLAGRPTTPDERHKTYVEAFEDIDTKDFAIKIALSDSYRVLIETRGGTAADCGGYFLISPSRGYKRISGKIQDLTAEEVDCLFSVARSLNMVKELETTPRKISKAFTDWKVDPIVDFSERMSCVDVLSSFGWKVVEEYGRNVKVLRPGSTFSVHSGIVDTESNIFNCFSTSTVFDVGKGYSSFGTYSLLEFAGDHEKAVKQVIKDGYGVEKK